MPRHIHPEIEPEERAALAEARERFLHFSHIDDPLRPPFIELRKAADALREAMAAFSTEGPERTRLLLSMQLADPQHRPPAYYSDSLTELAPLLATVVQACTEGAGDGRGAVPDPRVQRWIFTAGASWTRRTGKQIAYAEDSHFWRALHAFGLEHVDVPRVSLSQLRTALTSGGACLNSCV